MFRDDAQACRAIRGLLHGVRLEHLWTLQGPTEEALSCLRTGGPYSAGEVLMLRVAFDLWNGEGHAEIATLLATLDAHNASLLLDLLRALWDLDPSVDDSSEAVERWIERQHPRAPKLQAVDGGRS